MSDGTKTLVATVVVGGLLYWFYASSSPVMAGSSGGSSGGISGGGGFLGPVGSAAGGLFPNPTTGVTSAQQAAAPAAVSHIGTLVGGLFNKVGAGAAGTSSTGYVPVSIATPTIASGPTAIKPIVPAIKPIVPAIKPIVPTFSNLFKKV